MGKYDASANLHTIGRFISWEMLEKLSSWPFSSNDFCIADLENSAIPREFHMVSHAWLAHWHPDPDKEKFAVLLACYRATQEFVVRLEQLDPSAIDRRLQEQLMAAMRHTAMLADAANAWTKHLPCNQFESERAIAGVKFHAWALDAARRSLRSPLWLDSYALPNPHHRDVCSFCRQRLNGVLFRIPQLINQGTCLVLPNSDAKHLNRGWVMLEQITALICQRLTIVMDTELATCWSNRIRDAKEQFAQASYNCGTAFDGARLPLLFAVERVRMAIRQSTPKTFSTPPPDTEKKLLQWAKQILSTLEVEKHPLDMRLGVAILMVTEPEYISLCRNIAVLPRETGRLLLLSLTYMATACLLSYCWLTNTKFRHEATETLVQACLYKFVWLDRNVDSATIIVTALEQLLNIKLLREPPHSSQIASAEDVDKILELYAIWNGGGVIQVSPDIADSERRGDFHMSSVEEDVPVLDVVEHAMFEPIDPSPEPDIEALRPKRPARKIRNDEPLSVLYAEGALPSVKDMQTLPIWASVAFAARCFRRVRPFLADYWPDISPADLEAVERLISISERRGTEENPFFGPMTMAREFIDPVKCVYGRADGGLRSAAFQPGKAPDMEILQRVTSRQYVIDVAISTGYAQTEAARSNGYEAANNAVRAAEATIKAVKPNDQIVADVLQDFDDIQAACRERNWRHFDQSPLLYFAEKGPPTFVDYNALQ